MDYQPVLSASEITQYVREVFPEADAYGWSIDNVANGSVVVTMQAGEQHTRPGGTVSGPTLFALADITAYMLVLAHVGKVALAVTTNLNINFLNKPQPGRLHAHGSLLKLGKRLAVCDVRIISSNGVGLVAHATATYSIPPR
jgi:uncharacterized protein (TIGR00369 family)